MFEAPPMHAAMAALEVYDRDEVFAHLTAMGTRLRGGIMAAAERAGHTISYSGPPTMPTLLFVDDADLERGRRFSREAAGRGALLHPLLNWNLCAAHAQDDIDATIEIVAGAMAATPPSKQPTETPASSGRLEALPERRC